MRLCKTNVLKLCKNITTLHVTTHEDDLNIKKYYFGQDL